MLLQIVFIVLIAGALIALLMNFRGRGRFGGFRRGAQEAGTLRITGVSPRPAAQGEQFVTITGTISGPSVAAETVYGRFAWDVNQWPFPGEDLPVVYPPGKPQHWQIGHPDPGPAAGL
ncbi:hypothetical protein C5E44_11635 [Nocardia nova]|uniref:hypothetical protein n=1 Tax=Nocardia nova TaxID=37330 RepID=UPI000CEA0368|nr:hypothetical protein C5E44_11635 [Nocardia nova]